MKLKDTAVGIGMVLSMIAPPAFVLWAAMAGQRWAQYIVTAGLLGVCGLMLAVLGSWTRAFWQRVLATEAQ